CLLAPIDRRKAAAQRFLGIGVALSRWLALGGNELFVFFLPFANEVLPLAHEPCQCRTTLGTARSHLGERAGSVRGLRPLRGLEHRASQASSVGVSLRREAIRNFDEAREIPFMSHRLPLNWAPLRAGQSALRATLNDLRGASPIVRGLRPIALPERDCGEVVEVGGNAGVLWPKRLLVYHQGALVKQLGLNVAALGAIERGEVVKRGGDQRVLAAKLLLVYRQGALVERLGLGVAALGAIELGEVVDRLRNVGVLGAERRLADGQGALVER